MTEDAFASNSVLVISSNPTSYM